MRIFFAGPLTDLKNPESTKAFYVKLADVAKKHGFDFFWAFLNGTDPVKNPEVSPEDVYQRDMTELEKSDLMVAYVGEPSTGTGLEIEFAYNHQIPVYLLYEKGKRISRMLLGCPAVKKEIVFTDVEDALARFASLLQSLQSTNLVVKPTNGNYTHLDALAGCIKLKTKKPTSYATKSDRDYL